MLRFIQSLSLKLRYAENGKMVKIFTAVVCFRSFFGYRIACHRIQYWTSETIFSDPELRYLNWVNRIARKVVLINSS